MESNGYLNSIDWKVTLIFNFRAREDCTESRKQELETEADKKEIKETQHEGTEEDHDFRKHGDAIVVHKLQDRVHTREVEDASLPKEAQLTGKSTQIVDLLGILAEEPL